MKTTLAIAFCLIICAPICAQPSTLDKSFGNKGVVTTDFDTSTDEAGAVLLLSNNKIVAAGTASTSKNVSVLLNTMRMDRSYYL